MTGKSNSYVTSKLSMNSPASPAIGINTMNDWEIKQLRYFKVIYELSSISSNRNKYNE